MEQSEKNQVIKGAFWKFAERIAAQLVSLIVSIILARLLSPSEYGTISLVMVFITIANVFVSSGFGQALIQKKDADSLDFSSVFYFSLVFTGLIYIALFFMAIPIADFYDMPILVPVLRVLSISVPIMGINSVQQAYVARRMQFRLFFYATFIGTVISAVVGIFLAYSGFGVWALVAQTLTNNIIDTIVLQVSIEWKITKEFSFERIKCLLSYGWKLLLQSLILQFYASLRSLLIGKFYTTEDLSFYTKGNQFPELISSNIDTGINTALFPVMSQAQDSIERIKAMARKTTDFTSYIMSPILIGFMAVAEPFISLLLTDKWLPCVPYLRICCIMLLFRAPQTAILQAIKAIGRSDAVLKVDVPIRIFAIVTLCISLQYSVYVFALSEIVVTMFGTILYVVVSKKIINYSGLEVCHDFLINILMASLMGIVVFVIGRNLSTYPLLVMIIQILAGTIIYIFLSILTKADSFLEIKSILNKFVLKYKKDRNMGKRTPNLCNKKAECCGCTACAVICPMGAIEFKYNSEGFLYPQVDGDKCIGCLRCEEICAFKRDIINPEFENSNLKVYASKSKDKNVIKNSSSGGMFTVFSDFFLDNGDAVAACKYLYKSDTVELSIILDKESRDDARGSKYIQAELKNSFNKVITFLKENPDKKMLIVGTGCQIAAMDLILKKQNFRDRVILIDLVCHGVASSNLWKEYIKKVKIQKGTNLSHVTFKNKRHGWESPSTFAIINDKEVSIKPYSDWFYMGWSLRESCYNCPYSRIERNSDITIGDYWGIQNVIPDFYDNMGVSLVITHTSTGSKLFEDVESKIDFRISNEKDCLQPRLVSPQVKPNDRGQFWNDMQYKGMDYCIKNYVEHYDVSFKEQIKRKIKKLIAKF